MPTTDPTAANPTPPVKPIQNATPPDGADGGGITNDPKEVTFTQEQVNAALAKVRKEEKDKLYPDLQKAKSSVEEQAKKLADSEAAMKAEADRATALEAQLQEIQDSTLSDSEKMEKRLSGLEATTKQTEATAKQALEASKAENAKLRLELHKAEAVSKAGIQFPELVTGATPEEIDASVEQVKARETQLRSTIREDLRDEVAEELGATVPSGSSASDDTQTKTDLTPAVMDHKARTAAAKLPKDQYDEVRRKRLQEAKNSLPDNSRYRR